MSELTMYIIMRTKMGWPLGAQVAQACHACTALLWTYKDHPNTIKYMADIDRMRKVTLQVSDETELRSLADQLSADNIEHKLWIEQPENTPTCLAVLPYPKSVVSPYVKHLKLLKE